MGHRLGRRALLRVALAAAAVTPSVACTDQGNGRQRPTPSTPDSASASASPTIDAQNPFGLRNPSTVEVAVFDGGYGTDYARTAARILQDRHLGVEVTIQPVRDVERALSQRLSTGTPPDLVDNSGSGRINVSTMTDQLTDLTDVVDAPNLEGHPIRDSLHAGALEPSTVDEKLLAIDYVLTVFGLWYSASLFEENGWSPPKTWDDVFALGKAARDVGKHLFLWGREASNYYLELCLTSAIKEGGHDVRRSLDTLADKCWSQPTVQESLRNLQRCVELGYIRKGGSSSQYLRAQGDWARDRAALLYPCGSWLANEMRTLTAEGFRMTVAPAPTLTSSPTLPYEALHSSASESFIVPTRAPNSAGAKEFLRTMLSRETATAFSQEVLTPTIVKGTIPREAYGQTSLASQVQLLGDAGEHVFTWKFDAYYGLSKGHVEVFNSFLEGQSDLATVTKTLQAATDDIRRDGSIPKYEVR